MTEQSAGELLTKGQIEAMRHSILSAKYGWCTEATANALCDLALAHLSQASERADGVMVPRIPTEAMIDALMGSPWIVECETKFVDNVVTTVNKEYREQRYITDGWDAMLSAAPAASVGAPSREQVLHEVIRMVRMSPEYDHGGPFAAMMDQALAGKTPHLLVSVSYLQRGLKPPEASVSADARDAERLADNVWSSWLERLHPLDDFRDDGFSHCCRHCTLLLKSLSGWHLAKHDDDCLVNIAAKHSPEAQSQAVKDAAMEKK